MRNFVALLLLLAAVVAVTFLSPDPLYVRSQEEDGSLPSSVLKGVKDATRDTYESASQYAEKTGENIRDVASNVAGRVQSAVGAKPECEDPGAETRSGASLFDIARLRNGPDTPEAQPGLFSRAAETVGFGKGAGHHEAEEVSKWQKAKDKFAEASAAASEAAAHVREALFHKSQKASAGAGTSTASYSEQASESFMKARERLQEGAQSTFSTLGETAGRAKETGDSAADKAKDALGIVADSARQAVGSAYETASRTAGSAAETAGGVYGTARDKAADAAGSAYRTAKERAGLAFDRASQGAGSANEAFYIAIQLLREFPAKAGGAVSEARSFAYETISGAGSTSYETVKQAPQGVKETIEDMFNYVSSNMPSFGQETLETQQPGHVKTKDREATERMKQRARDVGEYMPNVGEGLSYGPSGEGPLEVLKRKLVSGDNEEQRKGFLDELRKTLSGYDTDERKQILDYIKKHIPGFTVNDEDEKKSTIEEYARRLATTPSKADRRTILDGVREMLAGYSTEERRGILDGLKERLSSYTSEDKEKGAVEAWKARVSAYFSSAYSSFKGEGGKGPTLDDITKRLAGSSGEERKGMIEGLKETLEGFTRQERKGPLDILREKLSIYSAKDEGKSILQELRVRFGKDESPRGKLTEALDKLNEQLNDVRAALLENMKGIPGAVSGGYESGVEYLRQAVGTGESHYEEESFYEFLKQKLALSADDQPQQSYYDSAKDTAKSGVEKVSEYADRAKESAVETGEKLAEENLGDNEDNTWSEIQASEDEWPTSGDNEDHGRNKSQGYEPPVLDAARRRHGAVSHGWERLGGYVGGAKGMIPEDLDGENEEFFSLIHGKQKKGGECECTPGQDFAPGSFRDVVTTVGQRIAGNSDNPEDAADEPTGEPGEQHQGNDSRVSPDVSECGAACGMAYLEAVGPIAGAAGAYEIEKICKRDSKPEAASTNQKKEEKEDDLAKTDVGRPVDNTNQQEQTKEADEFVVNLSQGPAALPKAQTEDLSVEKVPELPGGGLFTSLARLFHLAFFSISFGTSVWMTFISGQVLSKALPRQQFGHVQSRLFPASLMVVAVVQAATLTMHTLRHPWTSADASERMQFITLCFSLSANLINAFYLEPQVSKLLFERLKVEKEEGRADGSGGKAASTGRDAELVKQFNILHGYSSLMNVLSLVGQTWHMWYLARRLVI